MRFEELEKLLAFVEKPGRYVGEEWNSVRKDPSTVKVRIVFAFPEVYEVGMSHLGLQILYRIVNAMPAAAMERAFCPWPDMEQKLRESSLPLTTLETRTPIGRFDVVGFSLQHELTYTNVLNMLDLGKIPLRSAERGEADPIIIAGGPGTLNPEPLADFIDAFLFGDGEELLPEFLLRLEEMKRDGTGRKEMLRALSGILGVYVPGQYGLEEDPVTGLLIPVSPEGGAFSIKARKIKELDRYPFPPDPIVPSLNTVHNRYSVEISRGCNCGCRFCQAGSIYRPERFRSPESILDSVRKSVKLSGFSDVSLTSLSTGDYPGLGSLVASLMQELYPKRISLSLSSLRPPLLTEQIVAEIRRVRKTGFTLAPEAATERLRNVINKASTREDIFRATRIAAEGGWKNLKLYFMVGLPTETMEDVEAIPELAFQILREGRKGKGRLGNVNLSLSSFIPKPHSTFQWADMQSVQLLKEKHDVVRRSLRTKRIRFKWQKVEASFLEAVFSRGDRRLGSVLVEAFHQGCRFDSWTEKLEISKWFAAFEKTGVSPQSYVGKKLTTACRLPWEHVNAGPERTFLVKDYESALQEKQRPRCEYSNCQGCGVCNSEFRKRESSRREERSCNPRRKPPPACVDSQGNPACYRCSFLKRGSAKYLSHLELCTAFRRAFLRAGIPLIYSQGFHPMPRFSFGPPLPVNMEGERELLDFLSPEKLDVEQTLNSLNRALPEGIVAGSLAFVGFGNSKLHSEIVSMSYAVPVDDLPGAAELKTLPAGAEAIGYHREKVDRFLSKAQCKIEVRKKDNKMREIDIRPFVSDLFLVSEAGELHMKIAFSKQEFARATDVLKAVYGSAPGPCRVRRTGIELR